MPCHSSCANVSREYLQTYLYTTPSHISLWNVMFLYISSRLLSKQYYCYINANLAEYRLVFSYSKNIPNSEIGGHGSRNSVKATDTIIRLHDSFGQFCFDCRGERLCLPMFRRMPPPPPIQLTLSQSWYRNPAIPFWQCILTFIVTKLLVNTTVLILSLINE